MKPGKIFLPFLLVFTLIISPMASIGAFAQQIDIQQKMHLGGSGNDEFYSAQLTSDGGYIACGTSESTDGVFLNKGSSDGIVAKFRSDGSTEWIKNIGGSKEEEFYSVEQTADGGYIIAGTSNSNDGDLTGLYKGTLHGGYTIDAVLVKLTGTGSIQWIHTFGGTHPDTFYSAHQTADGGYIASGSTQSDDGDMTGFRSNANLGIPLLVKYDSSGAVQWIKTTPGTESGTYVSVRITADGGYITAGNADSAGGSNFQQCLAKWKSDGSLEWEKQINGSGGDDQFDDVQQTKDSGYIAVGFSSANVGDLAGLNKGTRDGTAVKFKSDGSVDWLKDIGGSQVDLFHSVQQTGDGGYIVAGYSNSNDGDYLNLNKGSYDGNILKLKNNGSIDWAKNIGGSADDMISSILPTTDGGYIVAGFTASDDQDFSTNRGVLDMFLDKIFVKQTLQFNTNGGTAITSISQDENTVIASFPDTTKPGYTLTGWYTDPGFAAASKVAFPYTFDQSRTVYAKWGYAVTYDSRGGSAIAGATADSGSLLTAPTDPTRSGYVFCGWFKDAACTSANQWNFAADTVTANTTLYARWVLVGDVNEDGTVDSFDASMIIKYFTGRITLTTQQLTIADMNSDGKADSFDANLIVKNYTK